MKFITGWKAYSNKEMYMKKYFVLCFVMICLFAAAAVCSAAQFTNQGTVLNVPNEYINLLLIDVPNEGEYGTLFSVTERASVLSAAKQGITWDGVGWLFSISRVDEETLHDLQCYNMFGQQVFAKDQKGDYYLYNHPTDVRMVREDYSDPKAMEEWSYVNNWGNSVKESFITDNLGLTPEKRSNTDLDIALSRILYMDAPFSLSTTQYGPINGKRDVAASYINKLMNGTVFEYQFDRKDAPDGEYVVFELPEENLRFDFFTAEKNLIRQVWPDGGAVLFYQAVNEDESFKATEIMNDLYLALTSSNGQK